jgi:hypothetical protein
MRKLHDELQQAIEHNVFFLCAATGPALQSFLTAQAKLAFEMTPSSPRVAVLVSDRSLGNQWVGTVGASKGYFLEPDSTSRAQASVAVSEFGGRLSPQLQ